MERGSAPGYLTLVVGPVSGQTRFRCSVGLLFFRLPTRCLGCGSTSVCGPAEHRGEGVAQEGSALLEVALPASPSPIGYDARTVRS